jgi:ATP-binding cassette subfamily B protein
MLVVAHRLTTAARADRIIWMEAGTHDELLAADGGYTAIWAAFSWLPERLRLTRCP